MFPSFTKAATALALSTFLFIGTSPIAIAEDKDNKPTADQQKETASDRKMTKQIRQSVVKDKSLSTAAHNVKIISVNGKVTLRGTVQSEEEKKMVADKAKAIAGAENVTNDLEVQADRTNKPDNTDKQKNQ
jgi:hyperosmotically inducible periplasmic protein